MQMMGVFAITVSMVSVFVMSIDAKPIVSLTFSGGFKSHTTVGNVLKSYGFNATFYLNSNNLVFLPDYMTVFDIDALVLQGFEIGGNTRSNTDVTTVNTVDCVDEICFDRGQLLANGWIVKSFAYTNQNYNGVTDTVVKQCGYSTAQIELYGETSKSNPYHIGDIAITPTTTIDQLKQAVSPSVEWVVYNFKNLTVSTPVDKSSVFIQLLDWLVEKVGNSEVTVLSIDSYINGTFYRIPAQYSSIPPTLSPDKNAFIKIMVGSGCTFILVGVIVYVAITSRCRGKCTGCCSKGCCGCCKKGKAESAKK